ncbi:MAG: ferredoxin family protein [Planctomycetes bacterium]|nr:ferredoxin family protein [Planctomycetota bacterium]
MSRQRLTVVLSQAQGKNPAKRALEEALAAALILEPGLDVSVVPYLYDLGPDHTGRLFLESIPGDMVVLSWLYPRAAFWLLDRDGIKGHFGETQLRPADADEDVEEEEGEPEPPKGIGAVEVPDRFIYCLDLRDFNTHDPYVAEIRRIAAECKERREAKLKEWIQGHPTMVQLGTYLREEEAKPAFPPDALLQPPGRRWYPVIDYSRCTNCMECIDFCLFGVYGVDKLDRILVENQDNCKRGCPACSRVCPEHAIMFPEYKTPAIAGAPGGAISGLKIDLSKLFGGGDALQMAADERDRELVRDGRQAVGLTVGIPKRQADKAPQPKDELDDLMDALDSLDL